MDTWGQANCNGQVQLSPATAVQQATFVLSSAEGLTSLAVWRSRLTANTSASEAEHLFERLPDVPVTRGQEVTVTLEPYAIYTLTTVKTGRKGGPAAVGGVSTPFPLPYKAFVCHDAATTRSKPSLFPSPLTQDGFEPQP